MHSYFKQQAEDEEKLNSKVAEMISLLTCHKKSTRRKDISYSLTSELTGILTRMDAKIQSLYNELPTNAMLIVCTGHGDTAMVQRYILILSIFDILCVRLSCTISYFVSFIIIEVITFLKPTVVLELLLPMMCGSGIMVSWEFAFCFILLFHQYF